MGGGSRCLVQCVLGRDELSRQNGGRLVTSITRDLKEREEKKIKQKIWTILLFSVLI